MNLTGSLFTRVMWLLNQADGELSAIGHRGTYEKAVVLGLSADIRRLIQELEVEAADQASVPPAVGATRSDRGRAEQWTGTEWVDA